MQLRLPEVGRHLRLSRSFLIKKVSIKRAIEDNFKIYIYFSLVFIILLLFYFGMWRIMLILQLCLDLVLGSPLIFWKPTAVVFISQISASHAPFFLWVLC